MLSSLASGLGFYKHGQEIAADVIAAGVKDVLGRDRDTTLIDKAQDGEGPVAEIFASALSLSKDAKSQVDVFVHLACCRSILVWDLSSVSHMVVLASTVSLFQHPGSFPE